MNIKTKFSYLATTGLLLGHKLHNRDTLISNSAA